ncbi:hypothetical protein SLEP1_g53801 [Rubroshorea leprosula]|uniref:Uncharacterized protein n=1 Tax=Rubroshorea leprosula TaxID=152421 RepID=A0AAV5MAD9_9ROSI|nr:hypothetical protein SLEP1_g53801 [Rubroshorea leprosula]
MPFIHRPCHSNSFLSLILVRLHSHLLLSRSPSSIDNQIQVSLHSTPRSFFHHLQIFVSAVPPSSPSIIRLMGASPPSECGENAGLEIEIHGFRYEFEIHGF